MLMFLRSLGVQSAVGDCWVWMFMSCAWLLGQTMSEALLLISAISMLKTFLLLICWRFCRVVTFTYNSELVNNMMKIQLFEKLFV